MYKYKKLKNKIVEYFFSMGVTKIYKKLKMQTNKQPNRQKNKYINTNNNKTTLHITHVMVQKSWK